MEFAAGILDLVESALTSIAIVVAGVWGYYLFWKKRIDYPRVALAMDVTSAELPRSKRLVHVALRVSNDSDVLLELEHAEVRLRQVVPTPAEFDATLGPNIDPIPAGSAEFPWPAIVQREWSFEPPLELEPGESDSLHADLVIENTVRVAELYGFVNNPRKTRSGLGWTITLLHTFNEALDMVGNRKAIPSTEWTEKQQRQQPRQPVQQVQQQTQQQDQPPTTPPAASPDISTPAVQSDGTD